ncbi:MAG TPA: PilZ domain-containing protein [Pyrinomonadaceae bacterium]|nr:PilZ domain-containing protein [Pyrinomonadaceae bacterium]
MSKIYTSYTEHFGGRNGHAAGVSWRGPERRAETRMHIPLHVKVCGNTADHEAFEIEGVVDNISRSGLYVVAGEALAVGTKLLIFMRPLSVEDEDDTTPFGIMRGEVKRVVRQADGLTGLGIAINHRRQHSPES